MIICLYKRAKFADVLKCLRYQEIREMIIRRIFKYIVYLIIFSEIKKLRKKGLRDFGDLSSVFIQQITRVSLKLQLTQILNQTTTNCLLQNLFSSRWSRNFFQFTFGSKSPPSGKKEEAFFVALAYWPELYIRSEPPYSSAQYI